MLYDNTDWTMTRQPITDFAAFKRGFQLSDINEVPRQGQSFSRAEQHEEAVPQYQTALDLGLDGERLKEALRCYIDELKS